MYISWAIYAARTVVFLRPIYLTRLLWDKYSWTIFLVISLYFFDTRTHGFQEFVEQNMMCFQTSGQWWPAPRSIVSAYSLNLSAKYAGLGSIKTRKRSLQWPPCSHPRPFLVWTLPRTILSGRRPTSAININTNRWLSKKISIVLTRTTPTIQM